MCSSLIQVIDLYWVPYQPLREFLNQTPFPNNLLNWNMQFRTYTFFCLICTEVNVFTHLMASPAIFLFPECVRTVCLEPTLFSRFNISIERNTLRGFVIWYFSEQPNIEVKWAWQIVNNTVWYMQTSAVWTLTGILFVLVLGNSS